MNKIGKRIRTLGYLLLAAVLAAVIFMEEARPANIDRAAGKTSEMLEKRMNLLQRHIDASLNEDSEALDKLGGLPEDMVLYFYSGDTLRTWRNQFPIRNDDISRRMILPSLTRPREELSSPLTEVTENPSFVNLGMKWYVAKRVNSGAKTIIAGLEIMDENAEEDSENVNRKLKLNPKFSVGPLSESIGPAVSLDGQPLFKITSESLTASGRSGAFARLFSPTLFSGGPLFSSLGAVLLQTICIVIVILLAYYNRKKILRSLLRTKRCKRNLALYAALLLAAMAAVCVFVHAFFTSVIQNSNITLELYKLSELSWNTALVYVMLCSLLMMLPALGKMAASAIRCVFGLKAPKNRALGRAAVAIVFSAYLIAVAGDLGLRKEQDRVRVWANRLSIERDISLEMNLRRIEDRIAGDQLIAALSALESTAGVIQNRVSETYLFRISQDHNIIVELYPDMNNNRQVAAYVSERASAGTLISEGSRFRYLHDAGGRGIYTGCFVYYSQKNGLSVMLLTISPKASNEDRGYSVIMGYSSPGTVSVPAKYSYAKYRDKKISSYRGSFSYPTVIEGFMERDSLSAKGGILRADNFVHFINNISDDDLIIVSRAKTEALNYISAFLFLTLVFSLLLHLMNLSSHTKRKLGEIEEKGYYRTRINATMISALVLTMVALAAFSVLFVMRRNNANMEATMSDKITSIQSMVQERCRFAEDYAALMSQEAMAMLDEVGTILKSDITLYTPDGREFRSTAQELFDMMLLGGRIDPTAYEEIMSNNRRFFINREKLGDKNTYFLYAPLLNARGDIIAIICSPYTDEGYDFETEAIRHSITVAVIFIILLILARYLVDMAVSKLFEPIAEVGRKMKEVDLNNPDPIKYERDDEIRGLVDAYNKMVVDLADSTRKLAESERDKAWATMARQVAHEIKNPLTPIKLQIQNLQRLKAKNPDSKVWVDRLDNVFDEILTQVQILADTANEFSNFAHLYSEDPVEIDLNQMVKEVIELFDCQDNIRFSFLPHTEGTIIHGPKPQLRRVFTNLIKNAVEALEQSGTADGEILVAVRLSSAEDGFYDVVVEDNGAGVKEENQERMFEPDFTTKSGGTGLGLAISRRVATSCGGDVRYSRSTALGGACFTVTLPKG